MDGPLVACGAGLSRRGDALGEDEPLPAMSFGVGAGLHG